MSRAPRLLPARLGVLGTGVAMPGVPVSNADMVRFMSLGVSAHQSQFVGKIADQLGVYQRFLARDRLATRELPRPGDTNPELSERAVRAALGQAGLTIDDVDLVIGHTTSPHTLLPPNVSWVADRLGYTGQYMELRQACTGFANALTIASSMLTTTAADRVCVVGSETGSVLFDVEEARADRGQLVNAAQMGDGAGAVILSRYPGDGAYLSNVYFGTLGLGKPSAFSLVTGGSAKPAHAIDQPGSMGFVNDYNLARAEGLDLFRAGFEALTSVGLDEPRVDRYLTHQANGRMGEVLSPVLGIPEKKFHNCAADYGNTGSASTWIGLHSVREQHVLRPGQVLGVLGAEATKFMYGGFTYVEGEPCD
ncbi:3-oxoacyl-ACP synthase III family protein [Actinokineospora auranticolor]|uniref:3-oxoacyl-[acyl-carrier-protein] synthase-3 n=1 Tax=Actinokineospora auranticolor TaxID=155976 RepID=A0A2S6GHX0_9PSEU|nr:3-oxoacyl-ACP synthase III family protein [Actinokineospora auranticolor]PPK64819.1 3-oxoacyl-[acyl-carrier-protein] synthase-3 [Actinokineospora auranticolor]